MAAEPDPFACEPSPFDNLSRFRAIGERGGAVKCPSCPRLARDSGARLTLYKANRYMCRMNQFSSNEFFSPEMPYNHLMKLMGVRVPGARKFSDEEMMVLSLDNEVYKERLTAAKEERLTARRIHDSRVRRGLEPSRLASAGRRRLGTSSSGWEKEPDPREHIPRKPPLLGLRGSRTLPPELRKLDYYQVKPRYLLRYAYSSPSVSTAASSRSLRTSSPGMDARQLQLSDDSAPPSAPHDGSVTFLTDGSPRTAGGAS